MEVSLVGQFSREFTFEDTNLTNKLNQKWKHYFNNRYYGGDIQVIYISIICVSIGFEPFFKVRPPKILKKISAFEYELKLDFEPFLKATREERKIIIANEVLKASNEVFTIKKVPGFDSKRYIDDLEIFLKNNLGN